MKTNECGGYTRQDKTSTKTPKMAAEEETFSRDALKKIATDPVVDMVVSRVKAYALIGNLMCDYSIPDTHIHLTTETLIRLLKPKFPDVTITQLTPRSIQIEWS
jgi:hypothetical protein